MGFRRGHFNADVALLEVSLPHTSGEKFNAGPLLQFVGFYCSPFIASCGLYPQTQVKDSSSQGSSGGLVIVLLNCINTHK